ncbi:hypothetical protein EVG20_g1530 [Dentipellis fragilis]|uniref:Protein kinase domain-containing protein n=1 Tax=Dentipellis fragilis TaxID=205917 RepID=A0A4Y9ZA95_9AGAM|nr:hypothetical protein EVG20_g1530 [Dentipellis fragilis]
MSSTSSPVDVTASNVAQLLAARKQARAARAQERQERAELHRRQVQLLTRLQVTSPESHNFFLSSQGNTNFENGHYREAIADYEDAIITDGPNTVVLSDMAAAYLAMEAHEEAERCAQRALLHDPLSTTARYRRGLARKGLGRFKGAATDFGLVLAQDPTFPDAGTQLEEVNARWDADERVDDGSSSDEEYPHLDDEKVVIESASDSSDYYHKGMQRRLKSIPCRHYNHEGCTRRPRCAYSHAPDHSSVRDNLGKNVCLYFLMDMCRFGAHHCEYSHCRTYLPVDRWWDDVEKMDVARGFLETPGVRENAEYVRYFFGEEQEGVEDGGEGERTSGTRNWRQRSQRARNTYARNLHNTGTRTQRLNNKTLRLAVARGLAPNALGHYYKHARPCQAAPNLSPWVRLPMSVFSLTYVSPRHRQLSGAPAMNTPYSPPEVAAWPGWPDDEPHLEEDINPPSVERRLDRARLRRTERQWRKIQPWLQSQGYLLRPRFKPGWTPSWQPEAGGKEINMETREDSIPHQNVNASTTIDAFRILDGTHVCLKRIPCRAEDSAELSIAQYLSQPEQRKDARNHAVPLLDVIRAPDHCFLVLPFYRTLISRKGRLNTVGEGFDLGLAYLHELRIAHRDCSAGNILMDADRMFPHGFHLDNAQFDMRGRRISKVRTRTQIGGVRYYLIDFGEAVKIGPSDSVLIDIRSKASIHAPETLGKSRPPYDPFKADIYTMGETYRKILIDGYKGYFDVLVPLINGMAATDPNARPTITEAMEQFSKIKASYSRTALHARVRPSSSERESALGPVFTSGFSGMDLNCCALESWSLMPTSQSRLTGICHMFLCPTSIETESNNYLESYCTRIDYANTTSGARVMILMASPLSTGYSDQPLASIQIGLDMPF